MAHPAAPFEDGRDAICEAARQLRQAAAVPFYADVADLWAAAFERQVRRALRAFEAHVRESERADSPVVQAHSSRKGSRGALARQVEEHAALAGRFRELRREIEVLSTPDVWSMIDLRECALRLERALKRHHRRLVAVVARGAEGAKRERRWAARAPTPG